MLKTINKKNYLKKAIPIVAFGVAGLLIFPILKYIVEMSNKHPRIFKWIFIIFFAIICVHGILSTNENERLAIICIGATLAIYGLDNNSKEWGIYGNFTNNKRGKN